MSIVIPARLYNCSDTNLITVGLVLVASLQVRFPDFTYILIDMADPFAQKNTLSTYFTTNNLKLNLAPFIVANLSNPQEAIHKDKKGKVFVTCITTTEGNVRELQLLKGIYEACDNEALRAIAATDGLWKAGKQNGKNVCVGVNIPIVYKPA